MLNTFSRSLILWEPDIETQAQEMNRGKRTGGPESWTVSTMVILYFNPWVQDVSSVREIVAIYDEKQVNLERAWQGWGGDGWWTPASLAQAKNSDTTWQKLMRSVHRWHDQLFKMAAAVATVRTDNRDSFDRILRATLTSIDVQIPSAVRRRHAYMIAISTFKRLKGSQFNKSQIIGP